MIVIFLYSSRGNLFCKNHPATVLTEVQITRYFINGGIVLGMGDRCEAEGCGTKQRD